MKKHAVFLIGLVLFFSMVGGAWALTYTNSTERSISTSGSGPASNGWFELGLPGWDSYADVDVFTITLFGHADNSSEPINMFLDLDADRSDYTAVAAKNVANNVPFTLTLDIKNQDLLYNGADVDDLATGLSFFDSAGDTFWVGYGCHFTHDMTQVIIEAGSGGQPPVPEPATMLLLGTGLAGFAVPRIRKRFNR